jgi:hypothetical protein
MNLDAIIAWVWEYKEIIGLLAVIATALGALYQPTRDLLSFLPKAVWEVIKFVFIVIWFVTWPIRKLIVVLYFKFAEKHVDRLFEKISDWSDKREAAKKAAQQPTE